MLANNTAQYQWMAASWQEQRDWALRYPLEALSAAPAGSLPRKFERAVRTELARLVPAPSLAAVMNGSYSAARQQGRFVRIPIAAPVRKRLFRDAILD